MLLAFLFILSITDFPVSILFTILNLKDISNHVNNHKDKRVGPIGHVLISSCRHLGERDFT